MDRLWKRVLRGQHTALVGRGEWVGHSGFTGPVFRVDCSVRTGLGGALVGLAQQLGFGRDKARKLNGGIAEWLDRALGAGPQAVVVFEHTDRADQTTLEELLEAFRSGEWLAAPLVLCFDAPPTGPAQTALLEALTERAGPDAVLDATQLQPSATQQHPDRGEGSFPLERLGVDELSVARVAAIIGDSFGVGELSALLRRPQLEVLEVLQRACDQGLPVADHGDGQLVFPKSVADRLRYTALPSLQRAYFERLKQSARGASTPIEPEPVKAAPVPGDAAPKAPENDVVPARARTESAEDAPVSGERDSERVGDTRDEAGATRDAIRRQLAGVRRARERWAFGAAVSGLERAEQLLSHGSPKLSSEDQEALRASFYLEQALSNLRGAGALPQLTLEGALAAAERAEPLLDNASELEIAELAATKAETLYELGSPEALQQALESLNRVSRSLLQRGHARVAARLLNDEAAIWIRLGDPVRANHLLEKSEQVFHERRQQNPAEQAELAETWHRFARLILHVAPRPGREDDAARVGIEHAEKAAALYQKLHDQRELARCWETMARLQRRRGDTASALSYLERALELQNRISDAIGLARSAGAAAELLLDEERFEEALDLFERSLQLNMSLGSYAGLEYNQQWLDTFAERLPPRGRDVAGPRVAAMAELLQSRLRSLGRSVSPAAPPATEA